MTPFITAVLIMLCGAAVGAICMWFYMDGKVDFWKDKAALEQGLKDKLLKQNLESLDKQLSIFRDLHGAFGKKKEVRNAD